LESLRQPLADKIVTISRVTGSVTYPASFMLVAAQNPCMCGFYTHPRKECTCSPSAVACYQKRISGPLLDRIDIFVEVPPVEYDKLVEEGPAEDSHRVREIQQQRFKDLGFLCNSELGPAQVWQFCPLEEGARSLLQAATKQLNLSARVFRRILKVSRTIADLEGTEEIHVAHLAEALQYRQRSSVS
jgi:magnesium chelatase family protein